MKKVFVFSDTHWALGRIHRGIEKQLKGEYEFQYIDWSCWEYNDFMRKYNWCDKAITNLASYRMFKATFPHLVNEKSKFIFVSHGYPEHDGVEYNSKLNYGIVSGYLKNFFPESIDPFLMPNGVDPDEFNYLPKDGTLTNLGWCGAPGISSKQFDWGVTISKKACLPLRVASSLTYDELKNWYNSIDLLIVTSIPQLNQESGPLPPFEAIVSGVPVIGTPVGNFSKVPGPKFKTIEEAVEIIEELKKNPDKLKKIHQDQYEYVMNNFTFEKVVKYWKDALEFS